MTKKQIKNHLESIGERVGDQVARGLSKGAENKGGKIGRKVGKVVGEQAERIHDALEKETVTKEEQLGIGGKIGTGLGIIGKRLVEKRYGLLGRLMHGNDFVSEGRVIGAKAEKIVKRAVKKGVQRIGRKKGESNKS